MNDLQKRKALKDLYNRMAMLILMQEQNGTISYDESQTLFKLLEEKCKIH